MARRFDGVDDCIKLDLGNTAQAMNGFLLAAIVNPTADNSALKMIAFVGAANSGARYGICTNVQERPAIHIGGVTRASLDGTQLVNAAEGWQLVVVNKAQFSSSTGRAHTYDYSTATWKHADLDSTSNDQGTSPTGGCVLGASFHTTPSNFWIGDIEIVGIYEHATALGDAAIEALNLERNPEAWKTLTDIRALWRLNQNFVSESVIDLSGGGANQTSITGTTVVPGPPGFGSYGSMMPFFV